MDVTEAVDRAKHEIVRAFADESLRNLGLEEVEFEELGPERGIWKVTVGFSRPWDREIPLETGSGVSVLSFRTTPGPLSRSYKVVRIADPDGRVLSIKDRKSEK
jgi:hypothetical protein